MSGGDNCAAVWRFVFVKCHSRREAARVFGLYRETVLKMCRLSLPPGCTQTIAASGTDRLVCISRFTLAAIPAMQA
jgi:hypothetical protein